MRFLFFCTAPKKKINLSKFLLIKLMLLVIIKLTILVLTGGFVNEND
jgi:hypothetical protein